MDCNTVRHTLLGWDAQQATFFQWASLVIAAVSLMTIAGNLLLLFVAWVATSIGLHKLLLLYGHRPEAQFAAWSKFTISRIGDGFLLLALVLIYRDFGTWQFSELFTRFESLSANPEQIGASVHMIGWLVMLGRGHKVGSVSFPCLATRDDGDTNTCIRLMHAGIVNAGGYLIIRLNPLFGLAPTALYGLTVIGLIYRRGRCSCDADGDQRQAIVSLFHDLRKWDS